MIKSKKFDKFLKIYETITEGNRQEKYLKAEEIYKDENGKYLYDDFRMFQAKLSMHYSSNTVHESNVAHYVRKK